MRYRQIFLAASVVMICGGCSGGDAAAQSRREAIENGAEYQQEKVYIKGPEGTPFAFLVERDGETGEVVRKGMGTYGEGRAKEEIDKKMLEAVLGENEEKNKNE